MFSALGKLTQEQRLCSQPGISKKGQREKVGQEKRKGRMRRYGGREGELVSE